MDIGILEYGCGNIRSVKNALSKIGVPDVKIIASDSDLCSVKKLIFPGVGAFDSVCRNLKEKELFKPLKRYLSDTRNKVLGICLGMQMLCLWSEEGSDKGLGIVDASVRSLGTKNGLKVPHMGWNTVSFVAQDPLVEGLGKEQDFYFVHSYCVKPNDPSVNVGTTDYGEAFSSIFRHSNVWGVQFHPEKSQTPGLKILSNFIHHA